VDGGGTWPYGSPRTNRTGYRLGDEWRPSQRVEPPATGQVQKEPDVITVTLIFYRQGFTVDDGPLRDYTDPENAEFLKAINKGYLAPKVNPSISI